MPSVHHTHSQLSPSAILARDKKYITCLRLVEHIVNRELGAILSSGYYKNLGKVSSFIDRSLDSLTLSQKAILLEGFDDLFHNLISAQCQEDFNSMVFKQIDRNQFNLHCTLTELYALYRFVSYQKELGLLVELKSFGKSIISVSIRQNLAVSSIEITTLLEQEGKLVIGLLESNLAHRCNSANNLKQTIALLTRFEQILNLGDDFLDVRKDINTGRISIQKSIHHRLILFAKLTSQIIRTFTKNPLKCMYYYPKCSFYYLKYSR